MTSRDYQLMNLRYSCPQLRREQIQEGKVPTAPTIASMMAALEVQEALKLIHDLPVAAGSAMVFNGVTNQFYTTKLPLRDDCLSHETYPEPVALGLGNRDTAAALFAAVRSRTMLEGPLRLCLDRDLVVALDCPRCGWRDTVFRVRSHVREGDAVCPHCREPARPELLHTVEEDSPPTAHRLAELGIPPYDIVRVDGASESCFVLLDADRPVHP
jgi:adenylyltransferase/sulfurtransferase